MLWNPGLVRVKAGDPARILVGPFVGQGDHHTIDDWKGGIHLVPRAACVARGLPLPEAEIDAERLPHVHAAARAAPYVAVAADEANACAAAGHRAVEVRWHRVSGGGYIHGHGGGPARSFGGELGGFAPDPADLDEVDPDSDEALDLAVRESYSVMIDRIVRAVSDDALCSEAVELARHLACITRPEVVDFTRGRIEADAELALAERLDWNDLLAEVSARAAEQRTAAEALVAALAAAPGDTAEVPVYGQARRVRLPAHTLDPGSAAPLHLPAFTVWVVRSVAPWIPHAGYEHARQHLKSARRSPRRASNVSPTPAKSWPTRVVELLAGIAVLVLVAALLVGLVFLLRRC